MPAETPQRFGRYQVVETLGAGAMGQVFLARDDRLGRKVAVKTIRASALPPSAAAMMQARFDNEARAVAALRHPNVVQVYDVGVEGETPYLVMEVASGPSLEKRVAARQFLDADEATALCIQIAGALAAAHEAGILHRDVKPANILQAEPGVWKLADFGVARVPESSLTLAGQFLGTPAFAAPEAIQIGEMSPATDVYSLGATLYAALTGDPPYGPRGLMTPGALAAKGGPASFVDARPDVPPALAALILRAVARDASERPSAADMARGAAGASAITASAPQPAAPPAMVAAPVVAAPVVAAPVVAALAAPTTPLQPVPAAATTPLAPAPAAPLVPAVVSAAPLVPAAAAPGVLAPAADPGQGQARRRRRIVGLVAAFAFVLVLGILIGSSDDEPGAPARPSTPGAAMPALPGGGGPARAPDPADGKRYDRWRKHWSKVRDLLDKGENHEAARKLREILALYPDDTEAQRVLDELTAYGYDGTGGDD